MDRLSKINANRHELGEPPLVALPDLATHCEECGAEYSRACVDGGRCCGCGSPVCATTPEQIAVWSAEQ